MWQYIETCTEYTHWLWTVLGLPGVVEPHAHNSLGTVFQMTLEETGVMALQRRGKISGFRWPYIVFVIHGG